MPVKSAFLNRIKEDALNESAGTELKAKPYIRQSVTFESIQRVFFLVFDAIRVDDLVQDTCTSHDQAALLLEFERIRN